MFLLCPGVVLSPPLCCGFLTGEMHEIHDCHADTVFDSHQNFEDGLGAPFSLVQAGARMFAKGVSFKRINSFVAPIAVYRGAALALQDCSFSELDTDVQNRPECQTAEKGNPDNAYCIYRKDGSPFPGVLASSLQ
jgi:hypothetical protein